MRTIYVTVESSKTDFISGLTDRNFKVSENKVDMPIERFLTGEPASIGILFDITASMLIAEKKDNNDAVAGIYEAVRAQPAGNEYFLIGFNRTINTLTDWTTKAENIETGLKGLRTLQDQKSGANIPPIDAIFPAIGKFSGAKHKKKALIIFSDGFYGGDTKYSEKEIIKAALAQNVQIYTLTLREADFEDRNPVGGYYSPGDPHRRIGKTYTPGTAFFKTLAEITGGRAQDVPSNRPGNLEADLEDDNRTPFQRRIDRIFAALRSQYSITYSLPDPKPREKAVSVSVKLQLKPEQKAGKGNITLRFREKFTAGE